MKNEVDWQRYDRLHDKTFCEDQAKAMGKLLVNISLKFNKQTEKLSILDFGCGTGDTFKRSLEINGIKIKKYTGVDINKTALERFKKTVPSITGCKNIQLLNKSIHDLDDIEMEADILICQNNSLLGMGSQQQIVATINRFIKNPNNINSMAILSFVPWDTHRQARHYSFTDWKFMSDKTGGFYLKVDVFESSKERTVTQNIYIKDDKGISLYPYKLLRRNTDEIEGMFANINWIDVCTLEENVDPKVSSESEFYAVLGPRNWLVPAANPKNLR